MTVFKTFFKIASKNIGIIMLYTVLLVLFGSMQFQTNDTIGFVAEKPNVIIVQKENTILANNLVDYFKENANIIKNYENIDDTLFYRQANFILYIYDGYEKDVLNKTFKNLEVKLTGDYMSSLANMMLNRYLNVQDKYVYLNNPKNINDKVNNCLSKKSKIEVKSKLNTSVLSKMSSYYNFASYTITAAVVLVISLILSSFNNINIRKRTIISSKNYKTYNTELLKATSIYAIVIWAFYNILSLVLNGSSMLDMRGLLFALNSLLFTITCLTLAILISNLINNKNSINGIVNVLALGSSFLCGVFVPAEWLGEKVLLVGHIFPTFYFVDSNNLISKLEEFNLETLMPIIINALIIIGFIVVFVILNNIITKYKRKVG